MKSLLFTGASGFLGKNIVPFLENLFSIKTVGVSENDDYYVDLAEQQPDFLQEKFDIVLHAAGKAHSVARKNIEKEAFQRVNYNGTMNLCKALEKSGIPKSFIFISTVAVYGCESGENITEEHPLNGNTPYALSKIQAENFLLQWCKKNNVILTILRPSLLAGPNPPGNLGAMIKGIEKGRYLSIAGGKARKSVLMVDDIARLIPLLVEKGGIYNICDNVHPTFWQLEKIICSQLEKKLPISIPLFLAQIMALCGDMLGRNAPINSSKLDKLTKSLTFSNAKVKTELGWEPTSVLNNFKIK